MKESTALAEQAVLFGWKLIPFLVFAIREREKK